MFDEYSMPIRKVGHPAGNAQLKFRNGLCWEMYVSLFLTVLNHLKEIAADWSEVV